MRAAKSIFSRIPAGFLLAVIFCLRGSLAAGVQDVSEVVLWDTRGIAKDGEVDLTRKKDWQRVSPDTAARPFAGDVVVENERIAVVFCRASAGPLVCPKSALATATDRSRLVPVAPGGEPGSRLS